MKASRQFEVNAQEAYTTVNVTVRRNEFAPRFEQSEWRADNLAEQTSVGTVLLTISATDQDGVYLLSKISVI